MLTSAENKMIYICFELSSEIYKLTGRADLGAVVE